MVLVSFCFWPIELGEIPSFWIGNTLALFGKPLVKELEMLVFGTVMAGSGILFGLALLINRNAPTYPLVKGTTEEDLRRRVLTGR